MIGLDFFRDFPAQGTLSNDLAWTDNLFGICQTASAQASDIGNEMPDARVGFGDFVLDGGKIIRRHLLVQWVAEDSRCVAEEAFSLLLARQYLAADGVTSKINVERYEESKGEYFEYIDSVVLGDIRLPSL